MIVSFLYDLCRDVTSRDLAVVTIALQRHGDGVDCGGDGGGKPIW